MKTTQLRPKIIDPFRRGARLVAELVEEGLGVEVAAGIVSVELEAAVAVSDDIVALEPVIVAAATLLKTDRIEVQFVTYAAVASYASSSSVVL